MFHTQHTLPPLSADEQAHSERLIALIRNELDANHNWMTFDRFMELALYAPGLGYYSAGAHKLGASGDFITAPEISALFSHCLAHQCAEVLQALPGADIVELGAGSGAMAADMLLRLEQLESLPGHYFILEVSADLQQRQRQLLKHRAPHLVNKVAWLDSLPENFTGCLVANEVLDALPVKRFVVGEDVFNELGVAYHEDQFTWQPRPADDQLLRALEQIRDTSGHAFSNGYCSEVNLLLPHWIRSLSDSLQRGVMLFIDYGLPLKQYYAMERHQGTLNCFYKHLRHDNPFVNIGVQDITAWVDFTALAESGITANLELLGFTTQANFLLGAGIDQLLHHALSADDLTDTQRWQLSQQVQQLMLPTGMGESFKAMAFGKNCDVELSGFTTGDLRHSL